MAECQVKYDSIKKW